MPFIVEKVEVNEMQKSKELNAHRTLQNLNYYAKRVQVIQMLRTGKLNLVEAVYQYI